MKCSRICLTISSLASSTGIINKRDSLTMSTKYKTSTITLWETNLSELCATFVIRGLTLEVNTSLILSAQRIFTCNAFSIKAIFAVNLVWNASPNKNNLFQGIERLQLGIFTWYTTLKRGKLLSSYHYSKLWKLQKMVKNAIVKLMAV